MRRPLRTLAATALTAICAGTLTFAAVIGGRIYGVW